MGMFVSSIEFPEYFPLFLDNTLFLRMQSVEGWQQMSAIHEDAR
jgi:hypothetical protein